MQMENSFSLAQNQRREIKSSPDPHKEQRQAGRETLLPAAAGAAPWKTPCAALPAWHVPELSGLECWRANRGSLAFKLTHVRCSARIFVVEKWPQLWARSCSGKYLRVCQDFNPCRSAQRWACPSRGTARPQADSLHSSSHPQDLRASRRVFPIRKSTVRQAKTPTKPSRVCVVGPFRFAEKKNKHKKFPRWEIWVKDFNSTPSYF